ncbi:hypothetical protein [Sphingopyxis sp.]|uniref:hypothetical protein n=1 Tax=Sphingopyxis sp. TaxID=1908224 RepID=UPI00344DD543
MSTADSKKTVATVVAAITDAAAIGDEFSDDGFGKYEVGQRPRLKAAILRPANGRKIIVNTMPMISTTGGALRRSSRLYRQV